MFLEKIRAIIIGYRMLTFLCTRKRSWPKSKRTCRLKNRSALWKTCKINLTIRYKKLYKVHYYNDLFNKYRHDIRNTWKVLNSVIGKQSDKSGISKIFNINDTITADPADIAESFCNFFSDVGPKYAASIPPAQQNSTHYLQLKNSRFPRSIFLSPTDSTEIADILNKLKPKNGNIEIISELGSFTEVSFSIDLFCDKCFEGRKKSLDNKGTQNISHKLFDIGHWKSPWDSYNWSFCDFLAQIVCKKPG